MTIDAKKVRIGDVFELNSGLRLVAVAQKETVNTSNSMVSKKSMEYYQSVKDCLPLSDGKFYDVMVIMYEDNISGGYKYRLGQYNNGSFHVEHNFYFQKDNFRNSSTQQKVIAWQPLEKCSIEKIREFINKATERNRDEDEEKPAEKENCLNCRFPRDLGDSISCWNETGVCDHAFCISKEEAENYCCSNYVNKDACVHFNEECDKNCIVHKLVTHNTCLSCNALRNSPHLSNEITSKTDIEIEKMQKEIEEYE